MSPMAENNGEPIEGKLEILEILIWKQVYLNDSNEFNEQLKSLNRTKI